MKLSVIIPACNEEMNIGLTVEAIYGKLLSENIDHEILVVNDHSKDRTESVLTDLGKKIPTLIWFTSQYPNGFGYSVRYGLEHISGGCVAIMMADLSDDPEDLVRFYRLMIKENLDCVFGSRFIKGGKTYDYPRIKLILNRMANFFIRVLLNIKYNDATNAFKMYRKETIDGLKPFLAPHFNFTIELPLKAIVRNYSYAVVPNSWRNRKFGSSKLKIQEMGSRYFFILLYCLIEKYFSRGDFKKPPAEIT